MAALTCALAFASCKVDGEDSDGNDKAKGGNGELTVGPPTDYTVTANNTEGTTTSLAFKFEPVVVQLVVKAVAPSDDTNGSTEKLPEPKLTIDDVEFITEGIAEKVELTGNILTVNVLKEGELELCIKKVGVKTDTKIVTISKAPPLPPPPVPDITYTVSTTETNSSTTSLTLNFGSSVSLSADDVVFDTAIVAKKGVLSGASATWQITVTALKSDDLTLHVNKTGISNAQQVVAIKRAPITYTVTPTVNNASTTKLTFAFSGLVTSETITLDASEIEFITSGVANKGDISNNVLTITALKTDTLQLKINKTGIQTDTKNVAIQKAPITYDVTPTVSNDSTTALVFNFSESVSGLLGTNIKLSGTSYITPGSLSGSGLTWTLTVTPTSEGTQKLTIDLASIDSSEHSAAIKVSMVPTVTQAGVYKGREYKNNYGLIAALNYINSDLTASQGDYVYTIALGGNETIAPQTLSTVLNNGTKAVKITLVGYNAVRKISLNANGSLFTVGANITLTLDDRIELAGKTDNNASLVKVAQNGTLIMKDGSKINGNTNNVFASTSTYGSGGGVFVDDGGTFTMSGGAISGNTVTVGYGGGVYVFGGGTFTMTGGAISGNSGSFRGGGVYLAVNKATFIMSNGVISGNTANYGGGVCIFGTTQDNNGIFTKTNGTIYGKDAGESLKNIATYGETGGYAVYGARLDIYRDTTIANGESFSSATM